MYNSDVLIVCVLKRQDVLQFVTGLLSAHSLSLTHVFVTTTWWCQSYKNMILVIVASSVLTGMDGSVLGGRAGSRARTEAGALQT